MRYVDIFPWLRDRPYESRPEVSPVAILFREVGFEDSSPFLEAVLRISIYQKGAPAYAEVIHRCFVVAAPLWMHPNDKVALDHVFNDCRTPGGGFVAPLEIAVPVSMGEEELSPRLYRRGDRASDIDHPPDWDAWSTFGHIARTMDAVLGQMSRHDLLGDSLPPLVPGAEREMPRYVVTLDLECKAVLGVWAKRYEKTLFSSISVADLVRLGDAGGDGRYSWIIRMPRPPALSTFTHSNDQHGWDTATAMQQAVWEASGSLWTVAREPCRRIDHALEEDGPVPVMLQADSCGCAPNAVNDIDIHRMECSKCGEIYFYSLAAHLLWHHAISIRNGVVHIGQFSEPPPWYIEGVTPEEGWPATPEELAEPHKITRLAWAHFEVGMPDPDRYTRPPRRRIVLRR